MRKESMSLIMVVAALLTGRAISQDIVIEPTNGRTPTTNHLSRPAVERTVPVEAKKPAAGSKAKSTVKPAKAPVKKARVEQVVAKKEPTPVPAQPSVTPVALKSEVAEAPASEKAERRPDWAMPDTRDAASIQSEISAAFARDPKLAGSAIQVRVDEDSVTLEGRAAGVQEHLQAQRLAQSYAWNRKMVDHVEVLSKMSAQK